ncbi:hypothetical protein ACTXMZ_00570 [Brachybacterium alimentarium]|uniref:hypothetical protein n=1 Tax=Brachybacterium alimentarium TaxID=47845 RepID=UPI0011C04F6A|nr:hypothetical protein [Brachybacterium alimentarium]
MPDMHDDAADQISRRLFARLFTDTVQIDGFAHVATPRRYIETAEQLGPVLDVQAVTGAAEDGGPLVYVGDAALTRSSAAVLRDHLGELLDILPEQQVTG